MNKKENWFLFLPHGAAHNSPPKYYLPASAPSSRHGMGAHPYCSARPIQHFVLHWVTIAFPMRNKYVGPPYSRTKIYAARMSRGSSSHRSTSAARARPQQQTRRPPLLLSTDGRDRRTDRHSTVFGRLPHSMWTVYWQTTTAEVRAAVGTEFPSPYPPHTHTHGVPIPTADLAEVDGSSLAADSQPMALDPRKTPMCSIQGSMLDRRWQKPLNRTPAF